MRDRHRSADAVQPPRALPRAAAAAVSEDVPVPGGTAALAQALGIDPAPDRGRFVYEIARLLYNAPKDAGRRPRRSCTRGAAGRARRGRQHAATRGPATLVPVPLTADLWSSAIFHRTRRAARAGHRDHHRSLRGAALPRARVARRCDAGVLRGSSGAARADLRAIGAGLRRVRRQPARRRTTASCRRRPSGDDVAAPLWEGVVAREGDARRIASSSSCSS